LEGRVGEVVGSIPPNAPKKARRQGDIFEDVSRLPQPGETMDCEFTQPQNFSLIILEAYKGLTRTALML